MFVKEDDETNTTDVTRSYFYGAFVDAKKGKTFIMKEANYPREVEQWKLYQKDSSDDLQPISRVL